MRYFCVDAYACIHTQWEFKPAWNHFGDLLRFDCPLGVYSRFGQQLFKNVKFSLQDLRNPTVVSDSSVLRGEIMLWIAQLYVQHPCFRLYFSNCSDIWLCLNAGDQGTHSNPLVNHHTQISLLGWFDQCFLPWNPCFFPMIFPWNIMKLIGRPPWRPVGALLLHHRKLVVETWESESRDLHGGHQGPQGPKRGQFKKNYNLVI
jgi:hypothetical protein